MLKSLSNSLFLVACASLFVSSVQAISKVSRQGRYLYTDDGKRFYIKGVAYQEQGTVVTSADNPFGEPSSFIDPLAIPEACSRDLPFLQQLNINAIRVYSVDSTLNHDACMSAFSNAGIYTIVDLSLPLNGSIDRTVPTWTSNVLDQYIATIDVFSKYDNVLAYNVGNEVIVANGTAAASFVKAAARDIRAYLASKGSSALVGYSSINGAADFREAAANFLSCDLSNNNSPSTAIDLYGLNDYEWCGDSTFEASYAKTTSDFANYNVAAYFSEYGCVKSPPRLWTESAALLSANMSDVWSGGIAFSYFQASSADGQFGMVTISQDGKTVTTSDDFDRLKAQYGQVSPPDTPSKTDAGAGSYPTCPATSTAFVASVNLPPTPNEAACNCLESTLSCQFTPQTANYSVVVGQLLDTACGLLGQKGGSCDEIGGDAQKGTYGRLSDCDPRIKLSYVMSLYYEINNRDGASCSFAGNGTVNPLAPSGVSAANSAATSCISSPGATFTPTAPAGSNGAAVTSGTGSGSSTTKTGSSNRAVPLIQEKNTIVGLGLMGLVGFASAVWTLA